MKHKPGTIVTKDDVPVGIAGTDGEVIRQGVFTLSPEASLRAFGKYAPNYRPPLWRRALNWLLRKRNPRIEPASSEIVGYVNEDGYLVIGGRKDA